MKVALAPDVARWIEAEIADGAFENPEDAVNHALREARINALRATLDASVAEGGRHSGEDMLRYVREYLANRKLTR